MADVSIILPTFNRAALLRRSINSVLTQTYRDFELIVVDDGSTDNTKDIVAEIESRDKRIRYLRLPVNLGANKARNAGIKASSGKYITFQDSDDEWFPDKLRKQVEILEALPDDVGITYCLMSRIRGLEKLPYRVRQFMPQDTDLYRKGLKYYFRGITMQSCLFRREVFDLCGDFDENLKSMQDTEMLMRTAHKFRFHCLPETLLNYYDTPDGISKDPAKALDSALYIFNKYHDDIKKDPEVLAEQYRRISGQMKKIGMMKTSKMYKLKALFYEFISPLAKLMMIYVA